MIQSSLLFETTFPAPRERREAPRAPKSVAAPRTRMAVLVRGHLPVEIDLDDEPQAASTTLDLGLGATSPHEDESDQQEPFGEIARMTSLLCRLCGCGIGVSVLVDGTLYYHGTPTPTADGCCRTCQRDIDRARAMGQALPQADRPFIRHRRAA